jgi:mannose-1-phosphate guanylyltransferase
MKAFLLAAGLGTRLGKLTQNTPKCLLPINGRPLLDYWFDAFESANVTDVLINLHYFPDQVRAYLAQRKTGIRIETLFEQTLLGSAGTLRAARDFVRGERDFFVVYADNFARVNLNRLREFHTSKNHPILTLVAYPTDEPTRCGILEIADDDRVISFEEKPAHPKSNFANAGLHIANADLMDAIPAQIPVDLGFHVLPKLIGRMYGYVTQEYIQDIGTPQTYARAQQAALR